MPFTGRSLIARNAVRALRMFSIEVIASITTMPSVPTTNVEFAESKPTAL